MDKNINFYSESIEFIPTVQDELKAWLYAVIVEEQNKLESINFIFCNDEYLHQINLEYLQHDNFTDIITFPYNTQPIEGDIFISIERVRENAQQYQVAFERELHRVMVHGVLHLLGYLDKSKEEKEQMTQKEDYYLKLFPV